MDTGSTIHRTWLALISIKNAIIRIYVCGISNLSKSTWASILACIISIWVRVVEESHLAWSTSSAITTTTVGVFVEAIYATLSCLVVVFAFNTIGSTTSSSRKTESISSIAYTWTIDCEIWRVAIGALRWTGAELTISTAGSSSDQSIRHSPICQEDIRIAANRISHLWLVHSDLYFGQTRIMCSPGINNSNVIKVGWVSTKIRESFCGVKRSAPDLFRRRYSTGLVIEILVQFND